jgi:hypothetical protein
VHPHPRQCGRHAFFVIAVENAAAVALVNGRRTWWIRCSYLQPICANNNNLARSTRPCDIHMVGFCFVFRSDQTIPSSDVAGPWPATPFFNSPPLQAVCRSVRSTTHASWRAVALDLSLHVFFDPGLTMKSPQGNAWLAPSPPRRLRIRQCP